MTTHELFPAPTTSIVGSSFPGQDEDSTKAAVEILNDNHIKHHGYFDRNLKFQNHITHHILAVWALGANRSVLEAAYKAEAPLQHATLESPGPITAENYHDHLGDDSYYAGYVEFFSQKVKDSRMTAVLDEFVFSAAANTNTKESSKAISRFMDNLVHPLIHIGYGLEFELPGLVIEGLALAATLDGKTVDPLFPTTLFDSQDVVSQQQVDQSNPIHAFSILQRVVTDSSFNGPFDSPTFLNDTIEKHAESLTSLSKEWSSGISSASTAREKAEELQWTACLLYAVTGMNKKTSEGMYCDFFLMHLVTSSLFIPSFLLHLSLFSQKILLEAYFTTILTWWVARGRRAFDISQFYATAPMTPSSSSEGTYPSWAISATPKNPWLDITQHAIFHPNDHVCKIQRAFLHYASKFGTTPAGFFSNTGLPGADQLDGTLFVRAASATMKRTSRASDDGQSFVWSFNWVA